MRVTGLGSFTGYSVKAYAINGVGTGYSAVQTFTTTTYPPMFNGFTLNTTMNTGVSATKAVILARASDPDGGTPALAGWASTSMQGGSVAEPDADHLQYFPANGFLGLDTFDVTVVDGQGGSVTGTVFLQVTAEGAPADGGALITQRPGGRAAMLFFGVPGHEYQIQRATRLLSPDWTTIATLTTASDGTLPWTDPNPPPTAYYHLLDPSE